MPVVEPARLQTLRRALARQLEPVTALQSELIVSWRLPIEKSAARERIRTGVPAFDPLEMIGSAGDLMVPYLRATVAIERAGLADAAACAGAREDRIRVMEHLVSWIAGESLPMHEPRRTARLAAILVGGSVLRRARAELRAPAAIAEWASTLCPCCGGAPDIAMKRQRRRTLICSRCDARWDTAPNSCLGCGASGEPVVMRVPSPMPDYELCICNSCGRYLKERRGVATINLLVERAMTAQIDAAAELRGLRI